mmetsp:Transcript_7689/g.18846  ORF Transcript_7689/g.18846 Transcript_7689/m.18846 type:complete len:91 (+) Transcript_7689:3482-3754(+)
MECPKGYERPGKCIRLKKALYGLKEAPRAWNDTLHKHLTEHGFRRSKVDPCLYFHDEKQLWVGVIVDDILYAPWFRKALHRNGETWSLAH